MRFFRKKETSNNNPLIELVNDLNDKSSTVSALSKGLGVSSEITKKIIFIIIKNYTTFIR